MKAKLLHLFAVCMAMVTAIPVANAAAGDYKINSPSKNWAKTFTTPNSNSRQLTVSADGQPFALSETDKAVGYVSTYRFLESGPQLVNLGMNSAGSANAFDDAGNYVFHGDWGTSESATLPPSYYLVRTFDKTNMTNNSVFPGHKYIDVGNLGRVGLYCDATGNVYGGIGYIWFAQTGIGTKIRAIKVDGSSVVNQGTITPTEYIEFDTGIASGQGNDNYVQFYETSNASAMKCLMQLRGVGIFDVTLDIPNKKVTSCNKITDSNGNCNSLGAHIFMLRGHKLLCRNTRRLGSTGQIKNCYSEFEILDITDSYTNPTKIKTIDHLPGAYTNYNVHDGHHTGSYIQTHKVSEDEVTIFAYVAGAGFSSYKITASAITNPVTSLSATRVSGTANNFTVSWAKPSAGNPTKYQVQYSSNGGSSWSTAVETENLNYTYSNLPEGTYTFRVRPYYGGSSTWGEYAPPSGSVATLSDAVASLNTSLDPATNNVTVSWAKPANTTPEKYRVSYSSNGGSSWSTAVETQNLSQSFSSLPAGSYIFKVAPYYKPYWGNEATSNSVTVINATGASISNLAYKYVKNTVTNIGRQDIVLMWEAPIGMVNTAVTGYKIYREGKLLATVGADVLTYTNTGVKQNYTYTVVPLFEGLTENSSYGQSVTTTEVTTTFVAPIISEIRNYEGYSLTELFYTMPDYMPYKPIYFNLYRDGKLIQGKLQAYNTLDESLVRSSETTIVKYQIEAVYGTSDTATTPIDSVKSKEYIVTIAPRDWAKTGFILQEVYNVPIDEIAADKKPNLFDNNNYYRQGQFNTFDKKWYIAQRADKLSKHDENPESGGGQIDSNVAGTVGGIITINAENADDVKGGFEKIFTKPAFENVGIAIDDKGTIFVRNNNFDKLKATVPTGHGGEAAWGWMKDAFERRITEGTFYKRNENGTYSEVATKLDLQKIWTDNRWIDKMEFTGAASNGQVAGRTDYYNMYGDVLGDGGYLILSPSWTHTAFKVYIKGGVYQSHEVIEFDRYENGSYVLEPKTGTENYGFHLDGRDAVAVQIRSNGYFGVHTPWSADDWHPIFTAESRVNNAGGTSIQAFGKKITAEDVASEPDKYTTEDIGRHTGELLVITPQSMHSNNVGDFLISRAKKENANDFADEGTLLPSIPVVMKVQTDARSNSKATNANGNWFHAEVGTYASALNDNEECLDIYQYVPGTRFARYRLVQSNQFPQVIPVLNITTAYNDDITEITHFEGVATWNRPKGFGTSTGSANAKVKSYIFEMYNSKNELVASTELPEVTKEDGSPIDDTYEYKFDYTAETGKDDIDFGRYSVNVQVKYETKDGVEHLSEPSFAEASHDYVAEEASDRHIWMYKNANVTEDVWEYDEDKKDWVTVKKAFDNYRIELDFNAPTGTDEPVSYYTIHAYVNNKKDFIQISDFHLHKGAETVNGVTQAILDRDEKGNVIPTSQVPGTYIFDGENSWKAPFYKVGDNYEEVVGGQSRQTSVLTWHHKVPAGYYTSGVATTAEGDDITITDEPNNWKFVVVAHYAANNRSIAKSEEAQFSPELYDFITTGVEVVGDEASSLSIYPIPAHSTITIKANKTINSVAIYNEAGVEVMSEMGDGDNMLDVNIEHLATGFYFVKVNNYAPVKIIKK